MARGLAVLCALAAHLHVATAGALRGADEDAVRGQYAALQADIDEWLRLGMPTEAAVPHRGGVPVRGLLVALPPSVRAADYATDVLFFFFSRKHLNGTAVAPTAQAFKDAGWKASRQTKVVVHGFGNDIQSDLFAQLVPALLQQGDYNVIGVDWGRLAGAPFYVQARSHVGGVGGELAKLVDALVHGARLDLKKLHCLGHSLGAHVCANLGKHMTTGKPARITGMDPAMPLFLLLKSDRLSRDDARLVDVVHTCAGWLGLRESVGHADFYVNEGTRPQPGCGLDLLGSCSHGRAFEYMAESANEPGSFAANECDSEDAAEKGNCSSTDDGNMGMNLKFDSRGSGIYYLPTADSAPFDIRTHEKTESA